MEDDTEDGMVEIIAKVIESRSDVSSIEAGALALYIFRELVHKGWALPKYA